MSTKSPSMPLGDEDFARIAHFLPRERGNVRLPARRVLEAVLHVMRTGCAWKRLPAEFGPWHTVYTRARRWSRNGVLARVLEVLHAYPSRDTPTTEVTCPAQAATRVFRPALVDEARDTHLLALAEELRPMIFHLGKCLMLERSDVGLSQLEVAVLMSVEGNPGIGVSTLAARTEQSSATISLAVRRLVQQGRLSAAPRAAADKRRGALVIAVAGHQALAEVRASRSWRLIQQLRTLPPDEVRAIEKALEPLQHVLLGLQSRFPPR